MAINVGSVFATLNLNNMQFLKSLNQASAAVQNFATRMQTSFGSSTTNSVNNLNKSIKKTTDGFKDLERIVSGILISQLFYRSVNAIQASSEKLVEFQGNMQQATIAMEYFLGTKDRAAAFLQVMKDFAAVTPFTTEQALGQAQRLMAMGFKAENVKSIMDIMVDTASATGATGEQMDRIVLALGQMKTNGYVAGQELRQLAEAKVPSYTILAQELGLTADQLKKIGDMKIRGDIGVEAILRGLEKRYKGAAARIAETLPGMMSTIKDDMLLIGEQVFKGTYDSMTRFVKTIRDHMEEARSIMGKTGVGGMFESMFSEGTQQTIRQLIGSLNSIRKSIAGIFKALGPSFGSVLRVYAALLSTIALNIAFIARVISDAFQAISKTVPAVNLLISAILGLLIAELAGKVLLFLWKVVRLGTVCTVVAQAVNMLSRAIQLLSVFVIRNPIVALAMVAAGALLYFTLSTKTAQNAIKSFYAQLQKLAGVDTSKILQPKAQGKKDTDEFNKKLETTDKNLKDVGKQAKETGQDVKDSFSTSFDELYQVPEKLGAASGALEDLPLAEIETPDIGLPGLEMPKLPTLEDFTNIFMAGLEKLKSMLVDFFTNKLPAAVKTFFNEILPNAAKWAIDKITEFFSKAYTWPGIIKDAIQRAADWIKSWTPDFLDPLVQLVADILKGLVDVVAFIVQGIYEICVITFNALSDFWKDWGPTIVDFMKNTFDLIMFVVNTIVQGIFSIITIVFDKIKAFWNVWGPTVTSLIRNVMELIATLIKNAVDSIYNMWATFGPTIITLVTGIWENIKIAFSAALDIILNTVGTAFGVLNGLVKLALDLLKGDWSAAWTDITTIFSTLWEGTKTNVEIIIKAVSDIFTTFTDTAKKLFSDTWDKVKEKTYTIFNDVKTKIEEVVEGLKKTFGGMKDAVVGTFKGMLDSIKSIINSIIRGINKMIDGINSIEIKIPKVEIPLVGTVGGGTVHFAKIPRLKELEGLETGGIVDRDGLYRMGEKGRREAVVPLENESYMKPFSAAVASDLVQILSGFKSDGNGTENKQPLYVGTLIADERSLKELERRMQIIRIQERQRKGLKYDY